MLEKAAAPLVAAIVLAAVAAPAQQPAPKAPAATATPFAIGTFEPLGSMFAPFASPLPNIGRTRSVVPACAVMRDLVIPSFAAALRADKRFSVTQARLPKYADIRDDKDHATDAYRDGALSKLEQDVANIYQETLTINKALGDPRISADSKDPQVQAERAQLTQLYEMQQTRANLLNQFVMRERVAFNRAETADNSAFQSRQSLAQATDAPPAPAPDLTAPPGMPLFNGIDMADKRIASEWGANITRAVRASENEAAKTFYQVAQACK